MQSFQDFKNSVKKSRKAVHSTPENGLKAHVIASFYNSGQGINPIAKIGITANNVYAGKGIGIGISKHSAPP